MALFLARGILVMFRCVLTCLRQLSDSNYLPSDSSDVDESPEEELQRNRALGTAAATVTCEAEVTSSSSSRSSERNSSGSSSSAAESAADNVSMQPRGTFPRSSVALAKLRQARRLFRRNSNDEDDSGSDGNERVISPNADSSNKRVPMGNATLSPSTTARLEKQESLEMDDSPSHNSRSLTKSRPEDSDSDRASHDLPGLPKAATWSTSHTVPVVAKVTTWSASSSTPSPDKSNNKFTLFKRVTSSDGNESSDSQKARARSLSRFFRKKKLPIPSQDHLPSTSPTTSTQQPETSITAAAAEEEHSKLESVVSPPTGKRALSGEELLAAFINGEDEPSSEGEEEEEGTRNFGWLILFLSFKHTQEISWFSSESQRSRSGKRQ